MPASGPTKPGMLSCTTGRPVSAKRAALSLALMIIREHCGLSRASTRSRMVTPRIVMRALSPPPMRRARPPASTRPSGGRSSVVMDSRFAAVLRALFLDVAEVLIEDDALLACEGDETLAPHAADERQVRLARQLIPPGREA